MQHQARVLPGQRVHRGGTADPHARVAPSAPCAAHEVGRRRKLISSLPTYALSFEKGYMYTKLDNNRQYIFFEPPDLSIFIVSNIFFYYFVNIFSAFVRQFCLFFIFEFFFTFFFLKIVFYFEI